MGRRVYKVVLDKKNRIIIPKNVRNYLGLVDTCQLNLIYENGKIILTRPNFNISNENKKFLKEIKETLGINLIVI